MMNEPQIVLVFSPETANLVLAGLNELPHGRVRALFDHIRAQAQQQVDAHNEAARRPPAPPEAMPPQDPVEGPPAAP